MASFSLCVSGELNKVANFYIPLTRIWELLCGALLVLIPGNIPSKIFRSNTKLQAACTEVLSLAGVILLMLSIFCVLNNKTTFPGWASLLPTLGAAIVIATGPNTFINRYVLGNRVFVFVGLISYPLYLWHWPFLSFPKIVGGLTLPMTTRIIAVTGATVFAIATYYGIERPLRHQGTRVSVLLLITALLIASVGYFFSNGALPPRQASALFQKIAAAKQDIPLVGPLPFRHYEVVMDNRPDHRYIAVGNGPKTTFYLGDSNMIQYWLGVESTLLLPSKIGERKAIAGGCQIPIPHVVSLGDTQHCNDFNSHAFAMAAQHAEIDTVVIGALWTVAAGYSYDDGKHLYSMFTTTGMEKAMTQLETNIRELTTHGKTVYLVLNMPTGAEFEPHNLIQRSLQGFKVMPRLEGGISLDEHRRRTGEISSLLKDVARRSGAIVLDPADYLCHNGWCNAVTSDGDPIYRDTDHLRGTYSYYHPEFIAQTLK